MKICLFLAIFIASTYSIEFGKDTYYLKNNQSLTQVKSFFKGSRIKFSAECPKKENITVIYNIKPYSCLPNDITTLSDEFAKLLNEPHQLKLFCHGFVEEAEIPNSSFPKTGMYLFRVTFANLLNNVTVSVEHELYGHLGPIDWPFLPFYSVMCVVYAVYALVWLVFCCCYWKDLLRVQFWIGAVIFMGMLEKAMFAGEYDTVRKYGTPTGGLLLAAEVISSIKKTTSRMLIIIVALGFGFIKPRLGTAMHKVTVVGLVFFVLSVCDSIGRSSVFKPHISASIIVYMILAMTDSFIILWIFSSLMKTIRTLTVRKNAIKLSLYWHFRNVLIFFVIVSLVYSFWSAYQFKWVNCIINWQDLWWDTAFWHLQFSVILLAIIVLWRPSANNQRYAYSPLHDIDDDDDDDDEDTEWSNEASGVTKLKKGANGKKNKDNEDEDLKWVDDNIPASRIDNVLSNMIDSDDEQNQKVELSKML